MTSPAYTPVAPDYTPHARAERLIAAGRFMLAFFSLIAVYLEPSTPARYQESTYTLLIIYTVYALAVVAFAWRVPVPPIRWRLVSHAVDLVLFAIFVYLTEGPASPFFLYFTFSLFCATLRFSWKGILATAVAAVAIYGILTLIALDDPGFEVSRALIREVYLGVIAALLVYLGIYQQRLRLELVSLAAWPRELEPELPAVLRTALRHAASVLRTRRMVLMWEESEEPWTYVARWSDGHLSIDSTPPVTRDEIPAEMTNKALFVRDLHEPVLVYEPVRSTVEERDGAALAPWLSAVVEHESALVVSLVTDSLAARLFVPGSRTVTADDLALAYIAGRFVAAQLEQYFFVLQIRQTASTEERLRISRELHDGVVQSLGGVGMQLQAIRSRLTRDSEEWRAMERVQHVIEDDQRELREIVRELRPYDPRDGGAIVADELIRMTERFPLEWGLAIEIDLPLRIDVPPRVAHEICRIANEALSNAARHGGATAAKLDLQFPGDCVQLRISDNGRGFPFEGRFDLDGLDRIDAGSRTLKERVKMLGASLCIESSACGATIEVLVPLHNEAER